jgi:hypothetical protein
MHLKAEEALDLIENRATEEQVQFWNQHFAICSSCLDQLQDWQRIHSLLKRENLESAPEALTALARTIFEPAAPRPSLREVIASVVFDSFSQPALAGARGASSARQILLSAEDVDVHVRVSARGTERRIAGQILSRNKSANLVGVRLHLLEGGKRVGTAAADKFGEFEFEEVTDGPLDLEIEIPHLRIIGALNLS